MVNIVLDSNMKAIDVLSLTLSKYSAQALTNRPLGYPLRDLFTFRGLLEFIIRHYQLVSPLDWRASTTYLTSVRAESGLIARTTYGQNQFPKHIQGKMVHYLVGSHHFFRRTRHTASP